MRNIALLPIRYLVTQNHGTNYNKRDPEASSQRNQRSSLEPSGSRTSRSLHVSLVVNSLGGLIRCRLTSSCILFEICNSRYRFAHYAKMDYCSGGFLIHP